ncbi:MAG: hypothetical protein WCS42_15910 [Verrucomicrobiota bacterium]
MKKQLIKCSLVALTIAAGFLIVSGCSTCCNSKQSSARSSGEIEGHVLIAGKPVPGSTVTLFAAGEGAPVQLA